MPAPRPTPSATYRRRHRLSLAREYDAAYKEGLKKVRGPLVVFGRPNGRKESRLGLSVSRRVGGATVRNTIKRRLRESFRLQRADLPTGYDLVINVRTHRPLARDEYMDLLASAWRSLDKEWRKRAARAAETGGDAPS